MPQRTLNLTKIASIADKLFSAQTAEELAEMKTHFGTAYTEGKAIAQIAVEMAVRIADIDTTDAREFTPVTALAAQGIMIYESQK